MAMATQKQIGFIRRLKRDRNIQADIDFDNLSAKEASELIEKLKKSPKAAETKQPETERPQKDDNELRIEAAMCFKLAHQSLADSQGKVPENRKEVFRGIVTDLVVLFNESMGDARAHFRD